MTEALIASPLTLPLRKLGLRHTVCIRWNPTTTGHGVPVICVLLPEGGFTPEQMAALKSLDKKNSVVLRVAIFEDDLDGVSDPRTKMLDDVIPVSNAMALIAAQERKPTCRPTRARRCKKRKTR